MIIVAKRKGEKDMTKNLKTLAALAVLKSFINIILI